MVLNYLVLSLGWSLFLIFNGLGTQSAPTQKSTLILTHVLFRHGNRTPNGPEELYPKDPYVNEQYGYIGLGQLTNAGKMREYFIGKSLRERYNSFLGPYYYPEIVDARSTDYNRTKMSLELVLASLFPPRDQQVWNKNLPWQPVPYNYWPRSRDTILMGVECPNYLRLYNQTVKSPKWQAEFSKYKDVFDYISENSGLTVTKFQDVQNLYFGLSTEEEFGLKLPQWTRKVWPKIITELAVREYFVATATTDLIRMASGYLLQKIIEDTLSKIRGRNSGRKMYLYSAHENNLAEMLIALSVFDPPQVPNYGAYIVFEVHNINGKYGFRIYYQNYVSNKPRLLTIPACGSFCEINKFRSLTEEYMPSKNLCYQ